MDEVSTLNLTDDIEAAKTTHVGRRWIVEDKGDGVIWVTTSPEECPDERFTARLAWATYPGVLPPSVLFVNAATGALGELSAWPKAAGFRPPNDICATWTAEGYSIHPEWRGDRSKRIKIDANPFLQFAGLMQQELDRSFDGRAG